MKNDPPLPLNGSGEEPARNAASAPIAQAARGLKEIARPFADGLGLSDLEADLARSLEDGGDTESLLYMQARLLDTLFKRMLARDVHSRFIAADGCAAFDDERLKLALRSQKQCQLTLNALTALQARTKSKSN